MAKQDFFQNQQNFAYAFLKTKLEIYNNIIRNMSQLSRNQSMRYKITNFIVNL